jgi:hypothetical protein
MESGFFDQKIFKACEKLKIGYVCGGKVYKDIKALAALSEVNRLIGSLPGAENGNINIPAIHIPDRPTQGKLKYSKKKS